MIPVFFLKMFFFFKFQKNLKNFWRKIWKCFNFLEEFEDIWKNLKIFKNNAKSLPSANFKKYKSQRVPPLQISKIKNRKGSPLCKFRKLKIAKGPPFAKLSQVIGYLAVLKITQCPKSLVVPSHTLRSVSSPVVYCVRIFQTTTVSMKKYRPRSGSYWKFIDSNFVKIIKF